MFVDFLKMRAVGLLLSETEEKGGNNSLSRMIYIKPFKRSHISMK